MNGRTVFLCAIVVVICSLVRQVSGKPDGIGRMISSETQSEIDNRVDKAKAKWKGESFWTDSIENLTRLESEKADSPGAGTTDNLTPTNPPVEMALSTSRKLTSASASPTTPTNFNLPPKKPQPDFLLNVEPEGKRKKSSNKNSSRFRSDVDVMSKIVSSTVPSISADFSVYGQDYTLEYESELAPTITTSTPTRPSRPATTKKAKTKKKKQSAKKVQGKKPKRPSFGFPRATANTTTESSEISSRENSTESSEERERDRATLAADLEPYGQDFYLEYESNDGNASSSSSSSSTSKRNVSSQYYPKNPTNLLNILQTLASNVQPIQMSSPLGGPVPPIPIQYNVNFTNRVPVRLNPPPSPFLLSLDLESFFTRMAISLFYSGVAIAPILYLMMGSFGGLSSLGLPFTGRKRRALTLAEESKGNTLSFASFVNGSDFEADVRELVRILEGGGFGKSFWK